jgi:hypothetical protein
MENSNNETYESVTQIDLEIQDALTMFAINEPLPEGITIEDMEEVDPPKVKRRKEPKTQTHSTREKRLLYETEEAEEHRLRGERGWIDPRKKQRRKKNKKQFARIRPDDSRWNVPDVPIQTIPGSEPAAPRPKNPFSHGGKGHKVPRKPKGKAVSKAEIILDKKVLESPNQCSSCVNTRKKTCANKQCADCCNGCKAHDGTPCLTRDCKHTAAAKCSNTMCKHCCTTCNFHVKASLSKPKVSKPKVKQAVGGKTPPKPPKSKGGDGSPKAPQQKAEQQAKELFISHYAAGCEEEQQRISEAAGVPCHFGKTNPHPTHCGLATKRAVGGQKMHNIARRDGNRTAVDYGANAVRNVVTYNNPRNPPRLLVHNTCPVVSNDMATYVEEQKKYDQAIQFAPETCQHIFGECNCTVTKPNGKQVEPDCFISTDSFYYASNFRNIRTALRNTRNGVGYAMLNIYLEPEEEVSVDTETCAPYVQAWVRGNNRPYKHFSMRFLMDHNHVVVGNDVITIAEQYRDGNMFIFKFTLTTPSEERMSKLKHKNKVIDFLKYAMHSYVSGETPTQKAENDFEALKRQRAHELAPMMVGKGFNTQAILAKTNTTVARKLKPDGIVTEKDIGDVVIMAINFAHAEQERQRDTIVPDDYVPKGWKLRMRLRVERGISRIMRKKVDLGTKELILDEFLNQETVKYEKTLNEKLRRQTAQTTTASGIWKHIKTFSRLKPAQVLLLVALGCMAIKLLLLLLPILATVPSLQILGASLTTLVSMYMGLFSPQSSHTVAQLPKVMSIIPSLLGSFF